MFIDYAKIYVKSGNGGNGAVAFRREKYVPKGGPSGGNGGKGGDIIFLVDRNVNTLLAFKYKRKFEAANGANGGSSLKDGKGGNDVVIRVPVGTVIKDAESEEILFDLNNDGMQLIFLKGGRGGKGNANFATSTNQTPRFAEDGKPGEEKYLILELKLIADVGLVGFPNAGKSTFISIVSSARPKIADYPFTTLQPVLGIVNYKNFPNFLIADIPGIIEGAHQGKGLGHRFLKHIERTKILLILIDASEENYQKQYDVLITELKKFSKVLAEKPKFIAFTKTDLLNENELKLLNKRKLKNSSGKILSFSSISKNGIDKVLEALWQELNR